ncbi:ORF1 [Drosophila melanogaster Nora virus]|uniref:ORF1 n=1 Tax=Nora virus TaxID=3071212 RepID=D2WF97_NORAV|nr:ORF1 [Drosophila melanogaster Nora virus]ADB64450.1 ORF1 [Drosophila melanogaster Nora virus]
MINNQTNKKGPQLERVHFGSTQVVGKSTKRRQRGTKLDIEYTVRRNDAPKEQKFLISEIFDEKLDKQIKYEKKQNHTFIKPKLNLVIKEEQHITKKVLRGKERAATHAFMKEMVESNKIQPSWNVEYEKEIDEVDLFFMKKKTKPFSGFSIKELRDSLIVQSDDKNMAQPTVMSSIDEIVTPREEISVSAISEQLASLMERVDKLEKMNAALEEENKQLKKEREATIKSVKKEAKKIKQEKPQIVKKTQHKSLGVNLKITKTKVVGQEQCLEIENTQHKKFVEKPSMPLKVSKKMTEHQLKKTIRTWYEFDPSKLVQHQKEVLNSVVTNTTFADKVRETGIPKQKIRYVAKPPAEEKRSIHFYGYKPKGIPNKVWWNWVTTGTAMDAYEKADRYLYHQFKREMMIYRNKWVKFSKEFNPYLSKPKMVWEENTWEYEYKTDVPYNFILKWRQLVQTYKPNTPIQADWYKISQKQQC